MSDAEPTFGPVQMLVVEFDRTKFEGEIVPELERLRNAGIVRLLDLLFVTRSYETGDVVVLEIDEVADEYGLPEFELLEVGIAGEEDVADFAEDLAPGTSAALLVVEHAWARAFAEAMFNAGGSVLRTERIPAPVVNEIAALSGTE